MTKIVGITGLIASGKSTLSRYLKDKGFPIFDADHEVMELYNDIIFLKDIKKIFPEAFVDNRINKNILSRSVFSNLGKKRKLEALIHPIIEKRCNEFIRNNLSRELIFLDVPLLFEAGWDKKCDMIILVITNSKVQRDRYIKRGGKPELFENILRCQGNVEEKILKSTYVLENNGSLEQLYDEADKIINAIAKNS